MKLIKEVPSGFAVFEKTAPEEQIKEIAVNYDEFNIPESISGLPYSFGGDYQLIVPW